MLESTLQYDYADSHGVSEANKAATVKLTAATSQSFIANIGALTNKNYQIDPALQAKQQEEQDMQKAIAASLALKEPITEVKGFRRYFS